MSFPNISGVINSNNLLRNIDVNDGRAGLVVSVATQKLQNTLTKIYSLQDAQDKGFTQESEPFAYGNIQEYYRELAGSQPLCVYGYPPETTMEQMLDNTYEQGVKKLLFLEDLNILAICRQPDTEYSAGSDFFDVDVSNAVMKSRALALEFQQKNKPFRLFIEARVNDPQAQNTLKPRDLNNEFAGIVLGGTVPDGSASVGLALARAAKYPAQVKLGSGQNGPLSATQIYIGSQPIEQRQDIETLHDLGLITFYHPPGEAGYYFGVDWMCTKNDFTLLVHGRIIDKAQRVIAQAGVPYLEDNIRINSDGTLNELDACHLEDIFKTSLRTNMEGQISDLDLVIERNQDIINTHTLHLTARILPLGYLTWITFELGLTTSLT